MAAARVLILGGAGVFGTRLARELLDTTAAAIVLAGRDVGRVRRASAALDPGRCAPLALDLADRDALARAATGCAAVACCAGPFQDLDPRIVRTVLEAGAHWVDISDDRAWVTGLLSDHALHDAAEGTGRVLAPGCSSVPCLSGVLLRSCRERMHDLVRARITLFIGNRNRKGLGSLSRALASGTARGVRVPLPPPVGARTAFRFDSPDGPLWLEEQGVAAEFRAAFEATLGWRVAVLLRPVGWLIGRRALARVVAALSAPAGCFGTDLGCLQVEAWTSGEGRVAAAVMGRGQRMPVLPAAEVLRTCLAGRLPATGVVRAWQWWTPDEWLARLTARGLERRDG